MYPDSNVHGANMGPIWGRQDPGGPHVGPMNFAIWVNMQSDRNRSALVIRRYYDLIEQSKEHLRHKLFWSDLS